MRLKWIPWLLMAAVVNLQVSPVWANKNAGSDKDEGDSGDNPEGKKGDPVDTRSGNNYFTETDFSFNTPGVPLAFSRKYNSIETYESPVGPGWSHSMDWRLYEAREIICKVVPPVTNANFKVHLWEGTQLLADGQSNVNGVLQTNVLTVIPEFYFGAPIKEPVDAWVEQPGGKYFIDLDEQAVYGPIGGSHPDPIVFLEAMGDPLPTNGIAYVRNTWLQVYEANGNTTRFWDNDNDGVWWASDKNWRVAKDGANLVLHLPGGIQRVFNADGRMIRHQNGWGRGISFTYSDGLLRRAEHDNGQALQFAYAGTRLSGINAGNDLDLSYTYDPNGLLKTVTRTLGTERHNRSYAYTDGMLTRRTNPAGHVYHYSYEADANGKLTHKATAGHVGPERWLDQSLVYRSETLTDFIAHSRGRDRLERMAYSSKTGKLTDNFGPGIGNVDAETRGIHYAYNPAGDLTKTTRFDHNIGETHSTYTSYDRRHNPVTNSVAYNATNQTALIKTDWNETWMRPSSIEDAEGHRTEMTYNKGSLKRVRRFHSESNSHDTAYSYRADGLLSAITNANRHVTRYTYSRRSYPRRILPAAGPAVSTRFDLNGHLRAIEILPENGAGGTGRVTQFRHNALGWLETVVHPDGRGVTNRYNELGYLINTVDRAGRATDYTWAPTRQLTSVTRYLEQGASNTPVRITYDYDPWFNTLNITEPRGRYVESYQLDVQDRVTSVTNIEGQVMNIEYGIGDFRRQITRFDGSAITNAYDGAGRRASVVYKTDSASSQTVSYGYHPDGQLASIADGNSSSAIGYDALNRPIAVTSSVPPTVSAVNYQYDPLGNITRSTLSLKGVQVTDVEYSYDAAERLKRLSTSDAGVYEYIYNPANGRAASVSNTVSGVTTSTAYDLLDRTTQIRHTTSNGALIRALDYTYDAAGMITNKVVHEGARLTQHRYQYDSIDRLVRASVSVNAGPAHDIQYRYDLAGNRTSVIQSGVTNAYALGLGNRLASWGSNGAAQYDAAGNTTNLVFNDGAKLSLEWDERYRLVKAAGPSAAVAYGYDALGRRTSRADASGTEYYVHNGHHIVADLGATGRLLRTYAYGPGIDNLLSMTTYGPSATNTCYYLKDHQNTVLALTDESGNVLETYDCDPYGNTRVFNAAGTELTASAHGNRYVFQGREIDWTTGLYHFRARWYHPETGRWLSKDPIGIAGGLNQYVFCANNPVNFVDPFGLDDIIKEILDILEEILDILEEMGINVGDKPPGTDSAGITYTIEGDGRSLTFGVSPLNGGAVGIGFSFSF